MNTLVEIVKCQLIKVQRQFKHLRYIGFADISNKVYK